MKTKVLLTVFLSFSFYLLSSQVPLGFNYQAIARDGTNNIIANQSMPARITLQTTLAGGTILYQETHAVTTNQFGLMTFVVGNGTPVSGTFSAINWQTQQVFIKTEIQYPGPGYINMGTSQLRSVPYSMLAKDLEGPLNKLGVTGTTTNLDEALFEVKNNIGQTIFAVYNEGVRVFVDDGAKGGKGGFAIGGFGTAKAPSQEYLRVTRDSTRVYVNPLAKGNKGGFAIGGFSAAKATVDNFLDLTKDNYFIGHQSGYKNKTGKFNSLIGYQSGYSNVDGMYNTMIGFESGYAANASYNSFFGYQSGKSNTSGSYNSFVGYRSGLSNTTGSNNVFLGFNTGLLNTVGAENVFVGYQAGYNNLNGLRNVFIGYNSGLNNSSGTYNIFLGRQAGEANTTGSSNVYIGEGSGQSLPDGSINTFVGKGTGSNQTSGGFNVYIGGQAGIYKTAGNYNSFLGYHSGAFAAGDNNVLLGFQAGMGAIGSGNVFIGYQTGANMTGYNNTLAIDNSSTMTPLIGGDFANNRVGINRIPTTYTLEVAGTIWANGTAITAGLSTWSDARYKKDITQLTNALSDVMQMQGVRYNWKQSDFPDLNFPEGQQIGVIAQDIEKILPELVFTSPDGYKSVSYEKLTPVLIEAIKEQQKMIDSQKNKIDSALEEINYLKNEIEAIKAVLKK